MNAQIPVRLLLLVLLVLPLAAGCASDRDVTGGAADSSDWFWTILIAVVTLAVGFLIGATASKNGGIRISTHRHRHHHRTQAGWNRIAMRIQDGTRRGLAEWRAAGHGADGDWDDLSRRIEVRILEEMRNHHD